MLPLRSLCWMNQRDGVPVVVIQVAAIDCCADVGQTMTSVALQAGSTRSSSVEAEAPAAGKTVAEDRIWQSRLNLVKSLNGQLHRAAEVLATAR